MSDTYNSLESPVSGIHIYHGSDQLHKQNLKKRDISYQYTDLQLHR